MSLVFFDGFDNVATMRKPEWTSNTGLGGPWVNNNGFDGSANGSAEQVGNNNQQQMLALPLPCAQVICGWHFFQTVATDHSIGWMLAFLIGGVQQLVLRPRSSNVIEVHLSAQNGTVIATSPVAIVPGTWQHIQVKAVIHTTNGSLQVQVDGVTVISLSGVQTGTTSGSVTSFDVHGQGGVSQIYDNFWVCDAVDATATQGQPFNDYLGPVVALPLPPNAAGDTTTWTPSTGANWATLDESPPTTTDYVTAVASATGSRDLYNLTDLPVVTGSVLAVQGKSYDVKADLGVASFRQLIKEGGVVTQVGTHIPTTSLDTHDTSLLTKRPSNGALWTAADVNALQVGLEVA